MQSLQKAARNIKEGNLDFEIKADADDEIGQLCQDFEEMRLRLKANAEEKVAFDKENKELISNISHDLKSSITRIKGYVEGITDGVADTPEKMDRYIKTIYNKANEMDLLINELTLYSKIHTNRIPYNFTTISAQQYFIDCAEDLYMELDSKGVRFEFRNYMEEDFKVIVDPEQLRRVINNIISNSLKYMDREGDDHDERSGCGRLYPDRTGRQRKKGSAAKICRIFFTAFTANGRFQKFFKKAKVSKFGRRS